MIRILDSVHKDINRLGSCGMTKSQVLESLIDFYKSKKGKNSVMNLNAKRINIKNKSALPSSKLGTHKDKTRRCVMNDKNIKTEVE